MAGKRLMGTKVDYYADTARTSMESALSIVSQYGAAKPMLSLQELRNAASLAAQAARELTTAVGHAEAAESATLDDCKKMYQTLHDVHVLELLSDGRAQRGSQKWRALTRVSMLVTRFKNRYQSAAVAEGREE